MNPKACLKVWFDDHDGSPPRAAYWKRVLLSAACVYPLIFGLTSLLSPLLEGLPAQLALLIEVLLLSAVLTWPVMPLAVWLAEPWLQP